MAARTQAALSSAKQRLANRASLAGRPSMGAGGDGAIQTPSSQPRRTTRATAAKLRATELMLATPVAEEEPSLTPKQSDATPVASPLGETNYAMTPTSAGPAPTPAAVPETPAQLLGDIDEF